MARWHIVTTLSDLFYFFVVRVYEVGVLCDSAHHIFDISNVILPMQHSTCQHVKHRP